MEAQPGETIEVQIPVSGAAQVVLDTSKKPKRQATPKQLETLAKAREKARLNREALRKAEAEAGGLKNIIDGSTATTTESAPTPAPPSTDNQSVVDGKRKASDAIADSDVPLAKRVPVAESSDTMPTTDSSTPASKPVATGDVSKKPRSKGKGKGKAPAKGAPLLWMPCEDPKSFGIKLKKPLKQFPPE